MVDGNVCGRKPFRPSLYTCTGRRDQYEKLEYPRRLAGKWLHMIHRVPETRIQRNDEGLIDHPRPIAGSTNPVTGYYDGPGMLVARIEETERAKIYSG